MPTISVFQNVSLDGYFTDANNDMSWAHEVEQTPDWTSFTEQNAKGGGMLVFGRVTYDLMRSYWPTPQAANDAPEVAQQMNSLPKVVFSRTLSDASWEHTTLAKGALAQEIGRLKESPGGDIIAYGGGTFVS
jgi:dihydrofolate reductase